MANTKGKAIKNKTSVYAGGRLWSRESFEAFRQYQTEYNREHYRQVNIRFNYENEADLIEWLMEHQNITGYIKEAIRRDMERSKAEKENTDQEKPQQ